MTTQTTPMPLDFTKLFQSKLRDEALGLLFLPEYNSVPLGDILSGLEGGEGAHFATAIKGLSTADIMSHAVKQGSAEKKAKPSVEVPAITDFKKDEVRVAYKSAVLSLLESTQMGTSRGLSPAAIRLAMGAGNEGQARELLSEMVVAKQIVSTGDTKGKKFVVARLLAQAEAVLATEKAEAAKKVEAAKVAKEKAEAEAAVKATPVVPVKTGPKAKA